MSGRKWRRSNRRNVTRPGNDRKNEDVVSQMATLDIGQRTNSAAQMATSDAEQRKNSAQSVAVPSSPAICYSAGGDQADSTVGNPRIRSLCHDSFSFDQRTFGLLVPMLPMQVVPNSHTVMLPGYVWRASPLTAAPAPRARFAPGFGYIGRNRFCWHPILGPNQSSHQLYQNIYGSSAQRVRTFFSHQPAQILPQDSYDDFSANGYNDVSFPPPGSNDVHVCPPGSNDVCVCPGYSDVRVSPEHFEGHSDQ